jgi:hypothetical protein
MEPLDVDESKSDALGLFRIDQERGKELYETAREELFGGSKFSMGERVARLLRWCENDNEKMYVCNCVGMLVTQKADSLRAAVNMDRPVAVTLVFISGAISLLAILADSGKKDSVVVRNLDCMRRILDELVITNLDPNKAAVRDILQSAMQIEE